jgi:hypothetical protein
MILKCECLVRVMPLPLVLLIGRWLNSAFTYTAEFNSTPFGSLDKDVKGQKGRDHKVGHIYHLADL